MRKAERKKLIVIHGWGGNYSDAAHSLDALLDFTSYWHNGSFWVPRRQAVMLRHLLNTPEPDRYIRAIQKLTVSRFLSSSLPPTDVDIIRDYAGFSEQRIRADFASFGLPISVASRQDRAKQLLREAHTELELILPVIQRLSKAWRPPEGHPMTEKSARELIENYSAEAGLASSLVPLLEMLREMHETGGDLDTVASATFYAHWIISSSPEPPVYGRDYEFIFINYHESLRHLARYAPADIYMADLPIGAFPDLEEEIPYLAQKGIHIARFEDHHPYPAERRAKLEQLVKDGTLGFLALSGPLLNEELPTDVAPQCGADMVYNNLIAGTPFDTPAAKRLRRAAHGEDFVTDRTEFGILLTDLIKGGICKIELAQILVDAMHDDDAMERLEKRGWARLPEIWHKEVAEVADTLAENVAEITLADSHTRILVALAVHSAPGKPRLTTGKAVEFFANNFPDADYIFYCFGSSIMVARRLNHADTTLNLGSLMPLIGTESDGGHAGAAVCRPDANPDYPRRLLGRVNPNTFTRFVSYLADRLESAGWRIENLSNLSTSTPTRWQGERRKVTIVLLLALLLGLLLVIIFPSFRPANVLKSNANYFDQYAPLEEEHTP